MKTLVFLAAAAAAPSSPGVVRSSGLATDLLVVLGAGVVLFGVLLLWVAYFRRRRSHRHHHRHHRPSAPAEATVADDASAESDAESSGHSRHRRRRRRREHRGRNPTLAETGGLPPPRANGVLPPAP